MLTLCNAKINIGLNITEKRHDGFHNIESIFYPININDSLEIIESKKTSFTSYGIDIPGNNDDNLCLKAYNLINQHFNLPSVKIILQKNIPIGAGLGGGSSDAANTIKLLNDKFKLNLSDETMIEYARQLGSDCAFFIKNRPIYAHSKGDVFEDIRFSLSDYKILLVYPNLHINTKEAYSLVKPQKPEHSIREIVKKPVSEWKDFLFNDFEKPLLEKYKNLKEIKELMYRNGAIYASMTGSGSAIYGIFNEFPDDISSFENNSVCFKI